VYISLLEDFNHWYWCGLRHVSLTMYWCCLLLQFMKVSIAFLWELNWPTLLWV